MDTLEALRLCCFDGLHKIGSEPGVDGRAIDNLVTRKGPFSNLNLRLDGARDDVGIDEGRRGMRVRARGAPGA